MRPDHAAAAHQLATSLLDLVLQLDTDGTVMAVTGRCELLLGQRADELLGRPVAEVFHDDGEDVLRRLRESLAAGQTATRELRLRHRQAYDVWAEVALRPLPGEQTGWLLGARDVTVRRMGERALEESRERYRLLFAQSPVGVMHYDTAARISDCNESFRRILGADDNQLVGLDMRKLRDPRVLPAIEAALEGRQGLYEGPYEATTSGKRLWISLRTVPFHGAGDEVLGGICIVEDVSARRRVDELQRTAYAISEAVHDTSDLGALFGSIHRAIGQLMPTDNIYFALQDRGDDTLSFPYFVDQRDAPPPPQKARDGLTERVLQRGEGMLLGRADLEGLAADGLVHGGTLPESWLGVPLRRGQEVIGAVVVQSYDPRALFESHHLETLTFVATQVALAIDRKRHEEQVAQMAFYDGMTGLHNRRMLTERAHQSLELARRHLWPVAVLYLDLDRFKQVNDTLGHEAGDQLLIEVARHLKGWLRASDTLARLGGDEFVFVLHNVDSRRATEAAHRILALLDRDFEVRGRRVRLAASIGIAIFPEHGETFEELLGHADVAMYQAKAAGGSFGFYSPEQTPFSGHRLELEAELRDALGGAGLEMHYQPIHRLSDGALVGFEALARWRRHGELLEAAEFVPVAAESELVRLLDWRLLRKVVTDCHELLPPGSPLQVSANLSGKTLCAAGLVDHVAGLLAESGLQPRQLILEVTESAALLDPARCLETLNRLAELGLHLTMDDFGSGLASLTTLRDLPFDRVKLDGSLIHQLGHDRRGEELVQGAISLCHGLGMEVVGEAVEEESQREWLRERGCDMAQGYLIGRPTPASELHRLPRVMRPARA